MSATGPNRPHRLPYRRGSGAGQRPATAKTLGVARRPGYDSRLPASPAFQHHALVQHPAATLRLELNELDGSIWRSSRSELPQTQVEVVRLAFDVYGRQPPWSTPLLLYCLLHLDSSGVTTLDGGSPKCMRTAMVANTGVASSRTASGNSLFARAHGKPAKSPSVSTQAACEEKLGISIARDLVTPPAQAADEFLRFLRPTAHRTSSSDRIRPGHLKSPLQCSVSNTRSLSQPPGLPDPFRSAR